MAEQNMYCSEESFNCTTIRNWVFFEIYPNPEKVKFFFLCLWFGFFLVFFKDISSLISEEKVVITIREI